MIQRCVHVLLCPCNNACKRPLAICRKSRHRVLLAGFCLSLYGLHVLNRDINMIQTNKKVIIVKRVFFFTRVCETPTCLQRLLCDGLQS